MQSAPSVKCSCGNEVLKSSGVKFKGGLHTKVKEVWTLGLRVLEVAGNLADINNSKGLFHCKKETKTQTVLYLS